MTPNVELARSFYSELFGWTSTDMATPMGVDYTQFYKDGKLVAGMGPMPSEMTAAGAPPVWSSYVIVGDLDATLARDCVGWRPGRDARDGRHDRRSHGHGC